MADTASTPPSLFDVAMRRLAVAGGAIAQIPLAAACVDATPELETAEQADWAQYEGQRRTDMVSFTGEYWSSCKFPNTRFGCGSYDVTMKLRVRPVAGADLAWKKVGVVFKSPNNTTERTGVGNYVTTWGNGDEEWHVTVNVSTAETTILFDAWYQDGKGHTYYDDNYGELHVANIGPSYNVIRVEPWLNTIVVDDTGVKGTVSVQVQDLDWDKEIELHATSDGWATVHEIPLHFVEEFPWNAGRERWTADVDIPGGAEAFEYAVVYRHGVVNGARVTEFWDNNFGANYRVEATPIP